MSTTRRGLRFVGIVLIGLASVVGGSATAAAQAPAGQSQPVAGAPADPVAQAAALEACRRECDRLREIVDKAAAELGRRRRDLDLLRSHRAQREQSGGQVDAPGSDDYRATLRRLKEAEEEAMRAYGKAGQDLVDCLERCRKLELDALLAEAKLAADQAMQAAVAEGRYRADGELGFYRELINRSLASDVPFSITLDSPTFCTFRVSPVPLVFVPPAGAAPGPEPSPGGPAVPPASTPRGGSPAPGTPAGTPGEGQPPGGGSAAVGVPVPPSDKERDGAAASPGRPAPGSPPPGVPESPSAPPPAPSLSLVIVKATQAAMAKEAVAFGGALVKLGLPDPPPPVAGAPRDTQTAHGADPLQGTTGPDGNFELKVPGRGAGRAGAGPPPGLVLEADLTPRTREMVILDRTSLDLVVGRSGFRGLGVTPFLEPRVERAVSPEEFALELVSGIRVFEVADQPVLVAERPGDDSGFLARRLGDLLGRDKVQLTEPDPCLEKKPGPQDPFLRSRGTWKQAHDDQWAIKRVGLDAGPGSPWAVVRTAGKPIVVAVIDTGLDWDHLDFARENLWVNAREVPDNRVDDDGNGYVDDVVGWDFVDGDNRPWDRDGHGTFVAGVIAASHNDVGVAGINPQARIMVLRALNDFGHTRASYVAEAIAYAADNGARVINVSVGGKGRTKALQMAIDHARSRGALVVVAAGNEAEDASAHQPAGLQGVLAVAASGLDDRRVAFSNFGPPIHLAAPGLDVLSLRARATDLMRDIPGVEYRPGSAYVGADRRYYRASGTSFSTPIVAGIASLVWSLRPQLSAEEVRRILLHSARDVDAPGRDQFTGYGLVDARAALEADPRFYVEAQISGARVAQAGGATVVEVSGTADADRFRRARLELGAGQSPQAWRPVAAPVATPVRDGVLAAIPAQALAGAREWTLRLLVEHENGRQREMRFLLTLG